MGVNYTREQLVELHDLLRDVLSYPDTMTAFNWSTLNINIRDHHYDPEKFFHWVCRRSACYLARLHTFVPFHLRSRCVGLTNGIIHTSKRRQAL